MYKAKGIVTMLIINKNIVRLISTISYIIPRIILWLVLDVLISSLVLSVLSGIILLIMQLITSSLIISSLIISGLVICLIQIIKNIIRIKTMTGTSRQSLFVQRVEFGENPWNRFVEAHHPRVAG